MHLCYKLDNKESVKVVLKNGQNNVVRIVPEPDTRKIDISLALPIRDMHSYWTPVRKMSHPAGTLQYHIDFHASATENFPLISFFSSEMINRGTVGISDLIHNVSISAAMNQQARTYDIKLTLCADETISPFCTTVDMREENWQSVIEQWREKLDLTLPEFPPAAWKPVFCSWYVVHADVDSDWIERNAVLAKKYGFGTFILDDGWCYDQRRRSNTENAKNWYAPLGDWQVSKDKFPDFAAHIKKVQAIGLRYMIWVAPFLVGADTDFGRKNPDALHPDSEMCGGARILNTDDADGCDKMLAQIEKIMLDYSPDGLKIDFLDQPTRQIKGTRGRGIWKFVTELVSRIRTIKTDALIEFRQDYAVPQMLTLVTQFRAVDCPFDYLINFKRCCQIRLCLGDNVPVHADPAYWAENEKPENIAKHLIAMFAGVPMLSVDLEHLNPTEEKIISFYLSLYRRFTTLMSKGHWIINRGLSDIYSAEVAYGGEKIIIAADPVQWKTTTALAGNKTCLILNLSSSEIAVDTVESFNPDGSCCSENVIPVGGGGFLRQNN